MLRSRSRLRAGGNTTDADAAAWATAVLANSGTYSASTLSAVSTFVKSAKASGYWDKLTRVNLFCGDQLAAALVPLKVGGGGTTDTNVNFVSGDYSESTGLTGNGSTKYLKTGLLANALTANDTHLALYNLSSSTGATNDLVMGAMALGGAGDRISLAGPFSDAKVYSDQYNTVAGRVSSGAAIGTPYGFVVGSRTAADAHAAYRAGSLLSSNTTTGGALPAFEIYVFAWNDGGSAAEFGAHAAGAYSIGSGLTSSDVTAYNTHMEAFQDALGRGVA